MAWAIGRSLRWIGRALLSPSGEGPNTFDDAPVTPVADVMQGGHALGEWLFALGDLAAGTSTTLIVSADRNLTRLVQVDFTKLSAVATMDIRIQLKPPLGSGTGLKLYGNQLVPAAAAIYGWAEIGQGATFWVVPPGWTLDIRGVLAVGDTANWRAVVGAFPAGSKPL